jgi:hypothetical protein
LETTTAGAEVHLTPLETTERLAQQEEYYRAGRYHWSGLGDESAEKLAEECDQGGSENSTWATYYLLTTED